MRLLYLTPTAAMGGAERVLLDLLATVRQKQPTWTVGLLVAKDGPLADSARALGVQTILLPFPGDLARLGDATLALSGGPVAWLRFGSRFARAGVASLTYLRRLRRSVAAFSPDVLHSNGYKMHVLSALARPSTTVLVWHFHDYLASRPVASGIVKLLKRRCDAVITVSDSVTRDVTGELGGRPPVRTIWNAVDLTRFSPSGPRLDLDAASGLPPAATPLIRVGLVATFARWKGHTLFLNAIKNLSESVNVRGYVVGGPLYDTEGSQVTIAELRAEAKRLGIEDRVGFTGFVREPAHALRALDVVVHASTAPEPFGLIVAEAMASGRAIVVSNGGGVAELVTAEHDALTYQQGDLAELVAQIDRLVGDAALRRRLGVAARASALEHFDSRRVAADVFGLYSRLLGGAAA